MAVVYHWKHGWIPLDHVAALSKAKGNHAAAAKMLEDAHGSGAGIHSRQDVAKGLLALPSVPAADQPHAHVQLMDAATRHSSTDLLPSTQQVGITQAGFLAHGLNTQGREQQTHGGFKESQRVLSQQTNFGKPGHPREWVPGHIEKIAHHDDGTADVTIRHDDGTVQVERIGKRGGGGQIKAMPAGAERGSTADNRSVTAQQRSAELAAQAKAKRSTGPTDAEKIANAETMFGTGSAQHLEAQRRFGGTPGGRYSIRSTSYRGEEGHTVSGKDAHGRQVKVFTPGERRHAEEVVANKKAGRDPFDNGQRDSNPHQRDPAATSRPAVPSDAEVQRAQAKADKTTADTMSNISDENLLANIEKYRATAPGSPTLRILETEAQKRGLGVGGRTSRTSAELTAAAEAKHAEAARIFGNVGFGDSAAGRLSGAGLKQFHRSTDSSLRRYTEAEAQAKELEHKAALAAHREREAARTHFTAEELKGAKLVQTDTGWHEVVRVNGKTVTVKTPYSWTDSIAHKKILKVAKPGSAPGKSRIHGPGES